MLGELSEKLSPGITLVIAEGSGLRIPHSPSNVCLSKSALESLSPIAEVAIMAVVGRIRPTNANSKHSIVSLALLIPCSVAYDINDCTTRFSISNLYSAWRQIENLRHVALDQSIKAFFNGVGSRGVGEFSALYGTNKHCITPVIGDGEFHPCMSSQGLIYSLIERHEPDSDDPSHGMDLEMSMSGYSSARKKK